MYLGELSILNFKNLQEASFSFSARINCFVGNNGVGKTNLLDAIHYLSMCKSHFNNIDSQNIKHQEDFFLIQGKYQHQDKEEDIHCGFKRSGGKVMKRNKKEYEKLADHIGLIPLVIITPSDNSLLTEGSEERRKFIDSVISQFDSAYLTDLIQYNRLLQQRNKLLKDFAEARRFDEEMLEIYSEQLSAVGTRIFNKRSEFIEEFTPVFSRYYSEIAGTEELAEIQYISQLKDAPMSQLLANSINKDRALEYTSAGVHKDDLSLHLNNFPAKRVASQGQQKTFVVALKLAEFIFIGKHNGKKPLLLLDDIFDKFDPLRVQQIIHIASDDNFGQIFITDTEIQRIKSVLQEIKHENHIYIIENSGIVKLN